MRSLLVAIMLFALGQTAGETVAYLTDSQNVNANAFSAATLFAPTGVAASASGTTVTVSWSAVGFSVDGYNVYRSSTSGGPYTKINGSVVAGTSYPDAGLAAGTYYYVVRLVNSRGTESATDSSQVSAIADSTPPTSTISAPTNGGYVATSPFTVTGTASDDRSGVQKVEVSTDGGTTWAVATGTTSWSYSWSPSGDGASTVQARATDNAGNVQSPVTSVSVTVDRTAPHVVPPSYPADGDTGYAVNRGVNVTFSEAMDQSSVQSAFALKSCTSSTFTAFTSTWTAPGNGTISWQGAGGNILRFEPSSNMATSTWYQISVTTSATDLAGNALSSSFTSKFQTTTTTDTGAPTVTITAPITTTWTSASTYTITGATDGMMVKVYRDNAPTGSFGGEDTLVTTGYTYAGASDYSISVSLTSGVANRFIVTATDMANNVSSPAFASIIYQGDAQTEVVGWGAIPGNTSINVFAQFEGDANANNAGQIRWRTPAGTGTYNAKQPMTRYMDYYGYTITGLSPSTQYEVEVTYADPDGIGWGTAVSSQTFTTTGGSTTGLLSSIAMEHERTANRAPQTVTLTANVTGSAKYVQFHVYTSPTWSSACLTPSGGVATFAWDGTDGSSAAQPDGVYTWDAVAYPTSATSCSGASQTMSGYLALSNASSIAVSPPPASVTVGAGQSTCITATARNRQGYLVEDGATIAFSFTASPTGGTYTLTQPATGKIGNAAAGCTAPAAGSGQAVAKLTVNTAVASTITVTATMPTQLSGTSLTAVSGSTTINDPPDAPDGLEVTPAGAAAGAAAFANQAVAAASTPGVSVRFRAPRRGDVAGYYLLIGSSPGVYSRKIDLGPSTTAIVSDGLVAGQRYYLAVQAYNKVGTLSSPSRESTVLVAPDGEVTALALEMMLGGRQATVAPGQAFPLRVVARNRTGQVVVGAAVTFSGPRGARFEPSGGQTGPDGSLATRLTLDAPSGTPVTVQASSGAATATVELAAAAPSVTVTAIPTGTVVASVTPVPTSTSAPSASPTASLSPTLPATASPTLTPSPAATATSAPTSTLRPTLSPSQTATTPPTPTSGPTTTPAPVATGTALPTVTPAPTSTSAPAPSATTSTTTTPRPTSSPAPTSTSAPPATPTTPPTATAAPTSSSVPTLSTRR